jgi:hypothetical protein
MLQIEKQEIGRAKNLSAHPRTNNYSTITISTVYSLLEHTVQYSQSVTRCFLVTAQTTGLPLPSAQVLSSQTLIQN